MNVMKLVITVVMAGMVFLSGGSRELLGKAANAQVGTHEDSVHEGGTSR